MLDRSGDSGETGGDFTAAGEWAGHLTERCARMPAPNRRNKGESLAHHISDHTAARGVADDRDRFKAQMVRKDTHWEEAAARLSPASRQVAEKVRASNQDKREQIEARTNQQNSAAAFRRVLDTPCPAHGVSPGEPCWDLLGCVAMCGARKCDKR